ncbi:MAG: CAP domain-containing protein, partial [Deltaproteobacteria bacterium]
RGDYAFQILAETAQGPLPFATWHIHAGPPSTDADGADIAAESQPTNSLQLLGAINRVRARAGCEALRPDPMLAEVAQGRAIALAARGAVAHALVRDDSPVTRLNAAGISVDRVAENVARAHTIGEASSRLDASPSHRANRIDPAVDTVGIGVATVGDDVYLVELYAARPRIGAGARERVATENENGR